MSEAWVVLRPLDVVEFRDGRPFTAGAASSARTTFPRPTSTAGAIKAAFGCEPDTVEGPIVVDIRRRSFFFPCPADLVYDGLEPNRLAPPPSSRPGVVTDLDDRPGTPSDFTLPAGLGKPKDIVLDAGRTQEYLLGGSTILDSMKPPRARVRSSLLATERRTGLARDGRIASPGMLYTAEFLRFRSDLDLGFACRVTFGGSDVPPAAAMVRLGGEARQAEVTVLPAAGKHAPSLPEAPHDAGRRVLVYLVTPAVFSTGWVPDDFRGGRLVSACVAGPEVAASWLSNAPRPQPAQWAVAAGGVYFVEFSSGEAAASFVNQYHGRCLPQADDRLRTAGFGMCLTGRW